MQLHTPGPWKFDYDEAENQYRVCGEDERVIARTDWDEEKDEANAQLIAAAPDLLQALLKLKEWVGKLEDWKGEDPPCEAVDAAISKATGKVQG